MVQGAAFAQGHTHHAAARLVGGLLDRLGNLARLAGAGADTAAAVTDDHERSERHAAAALDGFRDPVDRNQALLKLRAFFAAFAAFTATAAALAALAAAFAGTASAAISTATSAFAAAAALAAAFSAFTAALAFASVFFFGFFGYICHLIVSFKG
jgi:hypothetical protein